MKLLNKGNIYLIICGLLIVIAFTIFTIIIFQLNFQDALYLNLAIFLNAGNDVSGIPRIGQILLLLEALSGIVIFGFLISQLVSFEQDKIVRRIDSLSLNGFLEIKIDLFRESTEQLRMKYRSLQTGERLDYYSENICILNEREINSIISMIYYMIHLKKEGVLSRVKDTKLKQIESLILQHYNIIYSLSWHVHKKKKRLDNPKFRAKVRYITQGVQKYYSENLFGFEGDNVKKRKVLLEKKFSWVSNNLKSQKDAKSSSPSPNTLRPPSS